jgi:hypothetical protein
MVKTDVDDNGDRRNFGYSKPAVYQIKVLGIVPPDWSDRLGGMQISTTHKHEKKAVSILTGRVNDQAALSGILNSLYEMRLVVLSLEILSHFDD